ncbi:MAG TPA: protein kinase [Kofleriaceae bacterium]|nr:protein kinase [Kofleriaceae bacterium]
MSSLGSSGSDDEGATTASRFAPTEATELYCPACDNSFSDDVVHCPHDGTRLVRISDVRDALIGRNLEGRFLIKERLGTGGMGAVYRAWQGSVGREVAVKVIESRLKGGRLAAKRFLREAKLASRLSHANTVAVIDFGQTEDGLLYLVMELVKGRVLNDVLLEDGPFPVDRMCRVGIQLCEALEAAHKLAIIHRDLKPSNIILLDDPPGRDLIKVLDFGLAKSLVDEGSTTVTQSDAIMGTPSYIPPEAVTRMQFDERSDLYSLGVILYEVLVGRLPFEATTVQAMLRQHAFDRPKPLPEHIPPPVVDLLFRLLEKEPDRRPSTSYEVREMLASLSGIPDRGTPLPRSVPILSPGNATPLTGVRAARPATSGGFDQTVSIPRRNRGWLWIALIGIGLGAMSMLIASGVLDDSRAPQTAPVAAPVAAPVPEPRASGGTTTTPSPASGATAPVAADQVVIHVRTDPAGAAVTLDGEPIGKTPLDHPTARGTTPLVFELALDDYRTAKRTVVPDESKPVEVDLERRVASKPSVKSPRTGPKTTRPPKSPTGKQTPTKPPVEKPDKPPTVWQPIK